MLRMASTVFFFAVLGLYIAVNAYLFARLCRTLAGTGALRFLASALLLLFALSFPAGQILSRLAPGRLSEVLVYAGSLYLAPMTYAFFLTLAADILRLVNFAVRITPYPPPYTTSGRVKTVAIVVLLSLAISLAGAYNATVPTARYLSLDFSPPMAGEEAAPDGQPHRIRVVAFSDLHLGRFVTTRYLARLVELINRQKPDIVLLVGDVVDDLGWFGDPAGRAKAASLFQSINAGMGVWAIPGNHDYYAGLDQVARFMNEAGITLLRDDWATPQDRLLLIGRDDPTVRWLEGRDRKALQEIRDDAARSLDARIEALPMIVLDHRPVEFEEAAAAGATLHLAGHAHRGQLFPVNFIVSALYRQSYGEHRIDDTHFFVSNGVGTWGPPARIIGRPEIVVADINPNLHLKSSKTSLKLREQRDKMLFEKTPSFTSEVQLL